VSGALETRLIESRQWGTTRESRMSVGQRTDAYDIAFGEEVRVDDNTPALVTMPLAWLLQSQIPAGAGWAFQQQATGPQGRGRPNFATSVWNIPAPVSDMNDDRPTTETVNQ
jgi:hypothetical protein